MVSLASVTGYIKYAALIGFVLTAILGFRKVGKTPCVRIVWDAAFLPMIMLGILVAALFGHDIMSWTQDKLGSIVGANKIAVEDKEEDDDEDEESGDEE